MGAADVVISGAFGCDDTAGIDAFVTASTVGKAGESVFTWQDKENAGVWVGCVEGGAA